MKMFSTALYRLDKMIRLRTSINRTPLLNIEQGINFTLKSKNFENIISIDSKILDHLIEEK